VQRGFSRYISLLHGLRWFWPPWLSRDDTPAVFPLLLAKVLAQRREIVIEPREQLLACRTRFLDNWIFPHTLPFDQFLWRPDNRRVVSGCAALPGDRATNGGAMPASQNLHRNTRLFGVRSDPEPKHAVCNLPADSAVMQADSRGPKLAHLLEVKRRMSRVGLEQSKRFVCGLSYGQRKEFIARPEVRRPNDSQLGRPPG
jgi:hypothetical protein